MDRRRNPRVNALAGTNLGRGCTRPALHAAGQRQEPEQHGRGHSGHAPPDQAGRNPGSAVRRGESPVPGDLDRHAGHTAQAKSACRDWPPNPASGVWLWVATARWWPKGNCETGGPPSSGSSGDTCSASRVGFSSTVELEVALNDPVCRSFPSGQRFTPAFTAFRLLRTTCRPLRVPLCSQFVTILFVSSPSSTANSLENEWYGLFWLSCCAGVRVRGRGAVTVSESHARARQGADGHWPACDRSNFFGLDRRPSRGAAGSRGRDFSLPSSAARPECLPST